QQSPVKIVFSWFSKSRVASCRQNTAVSPTIILAEPPFNASRPPAPAGISSSPCREPLPLAVPGVCCRRPVLVSLAPGHLHLDGEAVVPREPPPPPPPAAEARSGSLGAEAPTRPRAPLRLGGDRGRGPPAARSPGAGAALGSPGAPPPRPRRPPPPPRAYHEHGDPGGQRVEERGGHGAAVLRARVGLAVGAVVAEEALHVHAERVGVLEVVRQHHRPCHDHHLEIEHAAAERRGPPRGPPAGAAGPPPGAAGRRGAAAGRGGGSAGSPGAGGLRRRRPSPRASPRSPPRPPPAARRPPQAPPARPRGRAGGRGVPRRPAAAAAPRGRPSEQRASAPQQRGRSPRAGPEEAASADAAARAGRAAPAPRGGRARRSCRRCSRREKPNTGGRGEGGGEGRGGSGEGASRNSFPRQQRGRAGTRGRRGRRCAAASRERSARGAPWRVSPARAPTPTPTPTRPPRSRPPRRAAPRRFPGALTAAQGASHSDFLCSPPAPRGLECRATVTVQQRQEHLA
uniref:Uncharacterized protein n=1 Tax=Canis lupus familiaris TaxID=9615 RepID=A0A8I3NHV0_CANLF